MDGIGHFHILAWLSILKLCANPELPFTLTVERIYADLLKYLMVHTQSFFESRTADGARTWSSLIDKSDIVIAHPNGWGLREQGVLRGAAIMAEIVSEADAGTRIRFVSEGEASVHFCLLHGNIATKMKVSYLGFLIFEHATLLTPFHFSQAHSSWFVMPEAPPSTLRHMSSRRGIRLLSLKRPGRPDVGPEFDLAPTLTNNLSLCRCASGWHLC
jgi:hypothetical protein